MDKLLHCNRCLILRYAKHLKFQNISHFRPFHLACPAQKQTHYDVLGVSKDATRQEIKAAFVRRSKEMHPDLNPNDPEMHDKFILVNEAYNILHRAQSRKEYDEMLQQPQTPQYARRAYYQSPSYGDYTSDFYNPATAKGDKGNYYGMKGINKRSNAEIALLAVSFILLGTTGYVVTFLQSYKKRKEYQDEIFRENERIYNEVRAKARRFTTAEQLEEFIIKNQVYSDVGPSKPTEQ